MSMRNYSSVLPFFSTLVNILRLYLAEKPETKKWGFMVTKVNTAAFNFVSVFLKDTLGQAL